jgi:hypothetical protein
MISFRLQLLINLSRDVNANTVVDTKYDLALCGKVKPELNGRYIEQPTIPCRSAYCGMDQWKTWAAEDGA